MQTDQTQQPAHPADFTTREIAAKDIETRDRAFGLRPPLAIHDVALRVALRLDELVEARSQAFPVRSAELSEALGRLKRARAAASSAIAHLSVRLHRDAGTAPAAEFRELYDLASLDRFGALVADGAELLHADIEVAAAMRRFAEPFTRETLSEPE